MTAPLKATVSGEWCAAYADTNYWLGAYMGMVVTPEVVLLALLVMLFAPQIGRIFRRARYLVREAISRTRMRSDGR